MPSEVDASEREPARRHAEYRAGVAILLPASSSRLAFGREACAPVPSLRRRVRLGIQREHGQQLDIAARSVPSAPSTRRARARRRRSAARRPRSRLLTPSRPDDRGLGRLATIRSRGRPSPARPASAGHTSAGDARPPKLGTSAARRRSTRTGASSAARRSTGSTWSVSSSSHADDIRGRVLEIAAPDYTNRFGRSVERVDILMATEGIRKRRSSATSRTRRTSRATPSTARSSPRRSSSSMTCGARSRRCTASSPRAVCCSPRCPASRRSRRSKTGSSASGGTTPGARHAVLGEEAFGDGNVEVVDLRERARRLGLPLRARRVRSEAGRARRPRPALRGRDRPSGRQVRLEPADDRARGSSEAMLSSTITTRRPSSLPGSFVARSPSRLVPAQEPLRRADELAVDAVRQAALDGREAAFERVEPALEPDDVRLTERGGLDRVRRLVDERRRRELELRRHPRRSAVARRAAACPRRAGPTRRPRQPRRR